MPRRSRPQPGVVGLAAIAVLSMAAGGCGPTGLERVTVSGTVRYDGVPVPDGKIRFAPTAETRAPVSLALIRDGKYVVDSRGGVAIGTYDIEITAHRPDPRYGTAPMIEGDDLEGPPTLQYIPARYNRETTLQITLESGSDDVVRDFDLVD